MRADSLEQVFLQPRDGVYQVLLVFESPAGARERVTLTAPSGDEKSTVDYIATYLVQRGGDLAKRPRLRVESAGGNLRDAPELLQRLTAAVGRQGRVRSGRS